MDNTDKMDSQTYQVKLVAALNALDSATKYSVHKSERISLMIGDQLCHYTIATGVQRLKCLCANAKIAIGLAEELLANAPIE